MGCYITKLKMSEIADMTPLKENLLDVIHTVQ